MNKLMHINTAFIILFFGFSTFAVAQEIKSDLSNDKGEVCSYLQYPPKEGELFNNEMLPITTVWFEDFACMDDTEDNRRRVIDAVARAYGYQGTDSVTHEPTMTRLGGHGDCFASTENPDVAVYIYYLYDHESIQGFVHTQPTDGICVASVARGFRGGDNGGDEGARGGPED